MEASALVVRVISPNSLERDLEMRLRTEVLRQPLGLSYSPQDLAAEADDVHLGAFLNDELLGCLLLRPLDAKTIKMRQVAVAENARGRGVGKVLVQAAEARARQEAFKQIHLNARETAVPFYSRLGFDTVGAPFEEIGLKHFKMKKSL